MTVTPSSSFWSTLERPIIGLSPMDGVTDAACRYMTATVGKPSVIMTEFTAAEGIRAGATRLLEDFRYHPTERPVVAQIFGVDPEAFTIAAAVAAALGFDGVDINMGCPAKNVSQRGAGAALIANPELAIKLIAATHQGIEHWYTGGTLAELGIPPRLYLAIEKEQANLCQLEGKPLPRKRIPVSVKTRIGIHENTVSEWMSVLASQDISAITIHGRTLKQLYTGSADWEAIATASAVIRSQNPSIVILGNGDVTTIEDGLSKMQQANTDGFLIGRQAIGNPWVFLGRNPTPSERITTAIAHAHYLFDLFGEHGFVRIRKHVLEYTKTLPGAKHVRQSLMSIHTPEDVERLLSDPSLLG